MPTVREDRVFVEQGETLVAYVAAGLGVTAAHISGSKVGEFALEVRCDARDVAATGEGVAVATAEDVLLSDGGDFAETGFGPAVAVTGFDGGVLAAGEDGTIAHYDGDWTDRGSVDADVRALDADLVAAGDGVHRLTDDGVTHAGLDDARDVAAPGVPQAATADGLFSLGNGWLEDVAGDFRAVAADPATATPGEVGLAHAATPEACFEHADGVWTDRTLPVDEPIVDATHAVDTTILLTATGTLVVDSDDGDTRHRSLGLPDAAAITVVGGEHVDAA
ncbi:HVO_0234 family beta-propeller protein [Halobacterium jilantaiense]|uniref:HVO-0234-like beta-propeller domain-containing protein n=1 Tax=Halobacterium jilantaiense TaxID=355548 RepID=A0A1I0PWX9_9EURY|nr:hypothetical protein [Halobacterium jilantaiense]SEW19032.1 hypothetical protein SAMN04487945_2051 [Halobacterium jilantaiense]